MHKKKSTWHLLLNLMQLCLQTKLRITFPVWLCFKSLIQTGFPGLYAGLPDWTIFNTFLDLIYLET